MKAAPMLTTAPAVEPLGSTFSRSHSSPDLFSLSTLARPAPSFDTSQGHHEHSLKALPLFNLPPFDTGPSLEHSLGLDGPLSSIASHHEKAIVSVRPIPSSPSSDAADSPSAPQRASVLDRPRSWLPTSKSVTSMRELLLERPATAIGGPNGALGKPERGGSEGIDKSRTVSDSFANFARRSWMGRSRSPSPSRNESADDGQNRGSSSGLAKLAKEKKKRPAWNIETEASRSSESLSSRSRALNRASNYLSKIKQRPQSMLVRFGASIDSDTSCASSDTSFDVKIAASDVHNLKVDGVESSEIIIDEESSDAGRADPLRPIFGKLDADFSQFELRNTSQRMVILRSTLVPFLQTYGNHPSNKDLYPADIARRATILDKWWTCLLDMLDGGNGQQPLAGVDRPTLLEALSMLMMRPEWRQTTSYFMPLVDRSPAERVRARSWTESSGSSLASSEAAFLAESAAHNVRAMFIGNLVAQMAIVVDKLSMRHAPLSLTAWAGKACAYAFFFAPGVAEILVRLWGLNADQISRVVDEFGLPRHNNGESEDIVALFPPSLGELGWSSVKDMSETLRQHAKMPLTTAKVQWHGPWIGRWRGRDTDLFHVFCKYFHILAEEFMPAGLPLVEKARSPAFALVHAQLLNTLDFAIHRHRFDFPLGMPMEGGQANFSGGPDSLPPMGFQPNNMLRSMSENPSVQLLRCMLSDGDSSMSEARHTFAEAFGAIMKCAAKRTSMFDHPACYTLCDFLEEALLIYEDYGDASRPQKGYIDWTFWFEVCKRILASLNTMSEIRMFAFIFSIWDAIAADPRRKESLCMDWLLTEETFNTYFNHWCPMVRSYYLRLLCWRVCRDEGSANEVDAKIFLEVSARLKTSWAHYLYLKYDAEANNKLAPSTTPSLPTPGKKFMIIRQELNLPQAGLLMSFDSFAKSFGGDNIEDDTATKTDAKKRWSLVSKVLSMTANNVGYASGGVSSSGRPLVGDQLDAARRDMAAARARAHAQQLTGPPLPPKPTVSRATTAVSSDGSSTGSSPVYEAQQYVFRFVLSFCPPSQPRDRILTRPRLPAPAQAWVSARSRSGSTPQPPPPGLPAPTRRVSGLNQAGLISGARNASPMDGGAPMAPRPSMSSTFSRTTFYANIEQSMVDYFASDDMARSSSSSRDVNSPTEESTPHTTQRPTTTPVKPTGIYRGTTAYVGRALAEWSLVVAECNAFIERRREEGMLGLSEVEVPLLGVEGFKRIG